MIAIVLSPVYTNNFYSTISMRQFLFARVDEQNSVTNFCMTIIFAEKLAC